MLTFTQADLPAAQSSTNISPHDQTKRTMVGRFFGPVSRGLARVRTWRRTEALGELNDHLLKDIGISRDQLLDLKALDQLVGRCRE